MRMTKKVLSVVLAVLMVVSMMSVMAVSTASAAEDSITVLFTRPDGWSDPSIVYLDEGFEEQTRAMDYFFQNAYNQAVFKVDIASGEVVHDFTDGTNNTNEELWGTKDDYNGINYYIYDGYLECTPVGDHFDAVASTCTTQGHEAYWEIQEYGHSTKTIVKDDFSEKLTAVPSIPLAAHNLTHHAAKSATYQAAGNTEYWECTECHKYFSDAAGTTEIAADSWVTPQKDTSLAAVKFTASNGTVSYYDALPSAFSSGTYQLLKDITRTTRMTPGITAKDVTLDLNGHTLTSTASDYAILLSRSGSYKFTLTDTSTNGGGKLVCNTSANTAVQAQGKNNTIIINNVTIDGNCVALTSENQTLTVDNSTINGGNDFALATNGSSTKNAVITVTNSTLSSTDVSAVYLPGDADATFTNDTVTGATAMYIKGGNVTIDGGSYTGTGTKAAYTYNGNGCNATGDAIVVENAGTSYPANDVTIKNDVVLASTNSYGLGAYTKNDEDAVEVALDNVTVDSAYAVDNAKFTFANDASIQLEVPADSKVVYDPETGSSTVVPKEYVAQVGETKYETLAEAIAAAQNGGTVKLLANQTIDLQLAAGEEYTIDLNSYTLTVESPQNYYNYIYGNLTIDDSSAAKTGKVVVDDYGIAPRAGGKVTVNSGSFTTADDYPYIFYLMGGELEVNGGSFTADHPVNCYSSGKKAFGGKVVINDGEFTSTDYYVISGFENSDITINGGEFEGPYPIYVDKTSSLSAGFTPASATINGGTFTATSKGEYGNTIVDCENGASVTIKGGTFTGGDLYADDSSDISVSGGTFDRAVAAENCADGFDPKDNGNGTYGVTPHEHDWDYDNVSWTFTENASHSIYAKYTLTCKTDATHTKEQTGSGTLMSTVAVSGDKFVYSHSATKIDGNTVAIPNYTRNVADGIINRNELVAASKVAGEYKLANDITGFYDSVKPVDGFVLDGQNHMIKYGTMNANNRVMFVAADQNTKFTLKNITLDGNTRAKWAVCAYTGNSGNNAGNVITLEGVTIQNFKSNDYVGAINAFGSSTWNLKDCTITGNTTVDDSDGLSGSAVWAGSKATINIDGGTYDEVYLHSYSGTGAVLNADGGATINNLVLDLTKTDTLKANIDDATVGAITANDGTIPEEAVVMDPAKATVAAPEGYKWVDSDETGMKTLAQIVYVAQIDSTKYETIGDAIEAAQDGDTIEILDDVNIGANWYRVNKEVTFDLGGNTVTGNDSFIVVGSEGDVTIKNGTVTSDVSGDYVLYADGNLKIAHDAIIKATAAKGNGVIVRNGGVLDVEGTIESGYYSIAGFGTAIVNVYDGASITSTDASALSGNGSSGAEGYTFNVMGGTLTSTNDVAIYHPNQGTLNITGGTITGATAIYIKSGSTDVSSSSTSIEGATIRGTGADTALVHSGNGCNPTGDAIVIENCGYPGGTPDIEISGGTIISQNADAVASYGYQSYEPVKGFVSGGSFSNVVPEEYCAEGYKPVTTADGEGMYTVTTKTLQEEVDANFSVEDIAHVRFVDGAGQNVEIVSKAQILGVQLRKAPEDGGVYTDGASNGIRFITAVDKEFLNAHPEIVNYGYNVTINGNTRFFSVKGTTNNVIETDDNDYNYYTFAITNIPEDNSDEIKVQFVFTTDGSTIAAKAAYKNASGVSHELVTNYADVKNY